MNLRRAGFLALFAALGVLLPGAVQAHEGEDHSAPPVPSTAPPAAGLGGARAVESGPFELLVRTAHPEPGMATPVRLLLADRTTNAPIAGATLEITLAGSDSVWLAQAASPGVYDVAIPFPDTGLAHLDVLIRHDESIELLRVDSLHVGALAAAPSAGSGGGLPLPVWIALAVVVLAILAVAVRAGLRARRAVALGVLVLLTVASPLSRDARAHEGESHGEEPAAPPPGTAGGAAVPAGTRYVAKEAQFEIGLRTGTARLEAIASSRRVFGTLVADASASAEIIAPQTGRYVGRRALQVGDRVTRGQTLGAILVVDELPVRSPIAGTLAAVAAVPGQTVVAGQSLAHVVDLTRLRLELPLYGDALAAGLRARSATIRLPGLPEESFAARVQGLAPTAGATAGAAVPLLLSVANPRGVLRPGMVVEAWLESPNVAEFVTVPVGALFTTEQGPAVFVKVGPEAFQFRAVTIGPRSGDRVGIVRGVSAGERVVVAGGAPLLATAEAPR